MEEIGLRKQPFVGFCAKGKKKKTETSPDKPFCLSVFSVLSVTVTVGCGSMKGSYVSASHLPIADSNSENANV